MEEKNSAANNGGKEKTITISFSEYEKLLTENNHIKAAYNNLLQEARRLESAVTEKRMYMLFDVIKNSEKFDSEFVRKCVDEVQEALTIIEEKDGNK